MNKIVFFMLLINFKALSADYGVHEDIFDVIEEDARVSMIKSASRADWKAIQEGLVEKAENLASTLPERELRTVKEEQVKFRRHEVTATRDIDAPLYVDGEIKWVTIVPKGTVSSPIIETHNPSIFAFFSGKSETQINLIKRLLNEKSKPLIPILLDGDPISASERLERHVYFATDEVIDAFDVEYTLSFVYEAHIDDKLYYKIQSFPVESGLDSISESLP